MSLFIDVCTRSLNKAGEELCGDKVEVLRRDDSIIIVLADGLGSGVKANILATLTGKIIGTMLKEGARIEEAVDTIAHTLPVCKERKLAYSTFTVLQIFNDGEVYMAEFDNPPVFFVRDGRLVEVPYDVREINGRHIKESRFYVTRGDTLVVVSDGVIHAGVGSTLNLGWRWENVANYIVRVTGREQTAARVASLLISVCDSFYMSRPGDDTTVVAVKIRQPQVVALFSGPPASPKDDTRAVREFMEGTGRKIICGGTTANIVSRELGRDIKTSLDYPDPSLPPVASIEGIDLVTEGVLTLNRTVEILKKYISGAVKYEEFKLLNKKDGASRLARILIDECTHLKLYIGRAMNPAHQNPDLPFDLSIKSRLLEEIAKLVADMGKSVEKKYY